MTSQPIPAPRPEAAAALDTSAELSTSPSTELRTGFTPVPRRYRHDGWTPERQRAFIAALAETGCVDRAARMVNMSQQNCYALRRAPGRRASGGRGTRRSTSSCRN